MARDRVIAQWHGDRQVTELLVISPEQVVTSLGEVPSRAFLMDVMASHPGLEVDIRPGAFRTENGA